LVPTKGIGIAAVIIGKNILVPLQSIPQGVPDLVPLQCVKVYPARTGKPGRNEVLVLVSETYRGISARGAGSGQAFPSDINLN